MCGFGSECTELITLSKFLDLFMWSTLISSEEIRNYGDN